MPYRETLEVTGADENGAATVTVTLAGNNFTLVAYSVDSN